MSVQTGARAVRTGQVFLVQKVILEFSARPSGWENLFRPDIQITELFLSFPTTPISSQSDI
jgi:hypothetical protein